MVVRKPVALLQRGMTNVAPVYSVLSVWHVLKMRVINVRAASTRKVNLNPARLACYWQNTFPRSVSVVSWESRTSRINLMARLLMKSMGWGFHPVIQRKLCLFCC